MALGPILILFLLSFKFWKKEKHITIATILVLFGMGFEAWLGKTVVDSNLLPYKITIHMIGSFFIIAMLFYIIYKTKKFNVKTTSSKKFNLLVISTLILTLIQVSKNIL